MLMISPDMKVFAQLRYLDRLVRVNVLVRMFLNKKYAHRTLLIQTIIHGEKLNIHQNYEIANVFGKRII